MTRLAFLGAGSMGTALIDGLLGSGLDPARITATTGSSASAEALGASRGIAVRAAGEDPQANRELASAAEIVVLGVKPWAIVEVLEEIAPVLTEQTIVLSVAAGVTLETLRAASGPAPVVKMMPNTPSALGRGAASVSIPDDPSEPERAAGARIQEVFAPIGTLVELPEDQIPGVTGIAGSGVAYFFQLAESLVRAGEDQGLSRADALALVRATAEGAGAMLAGSELEPGELRDRVVSKGGTTAAALDAFAAGDLDGLVRRAAGSAADRAREMG